MVGDFDLDRFVAAQGGGVYERAFAELRSGRKTTHWMWFVFPQVAGLGLSTTARFYAIGSLAEARAYVAHPVLGPRLVECAAAVAAHTDVSARELMGSPDDEKLRSSMTLFEAAAPDRDVFARVLDAHFAGARDRRTQQFLARG